MTILKNFIMYCNSYSKLLQKLLQIHLFHYHLVSCQTDFFISSNSSGLNNSLPC